MISYFTLSYSASTMSPTGYRSLIQVQTSEAASCIFARFVKAATAKTACSSSGGIASIFFFANFSDSNASFKKIYATIS